MNEYQIDTELSRMINYHPVFGTQPERYQKIREATKFLSEALLKQWKSCIEERFDNLESVIRECCPNSEEKRMAISSLYGIRTMITNDHCQRQDIVERLRFNVLAPAIAAIACNEVNEKDE